MLWRAEMSMREFKKLLDLQCFLSLNYYISRWHSHYYGRNIVDVGEISGKPAAPSWATLSRRPLLRALMSIMLCRTRWSKGPFTKKCIPLSKHASCSSSLPVPTPINRLRSLLRSMDVSHPAYAENISIPFITGRRKLKMTISYSLL